jgi:hypothetical protein
MFSNIGTPESGIHLIGPVTIWKGSRFDVTVEMGKLYVELELKEQFITIL